MTSFGGFLRFKAYAFDDRSQYIQITNILSIVFAILSAFLILILYLLFGWTFALNLVLVIIALFGLVVLLNKFGFHNVGRMLFCLTPVWMTMITAVVGKIMDPHQSYVGYFDSRFILLMTTVLPAIVFDLKERSKLLVCLGSVFVCLIFYDTIHNAFGVGYYQRGFDLPSYYYINYVSFIAFSGLVSAVFVLKFRDEKATQQLQQLIRDKQRMNDQLNTRNQELHAATSELETQNEEMQQQQEELHASHDKLEEAHRLIQEQQEKLYANNVQLERLVDEKGKDLVKANEELIKSNNELRQFSFTVSHNLRGPVARLLGLTNLARYSKNEQEIERLVSYIHHSASELDSILKDLSHIIDIRNDLYRVKEKISINDEWQRALLLLDEAGSSVHIETEFSQAPDVFGIRPMVQSIFYNLLSNAVKYKDPHRELKIQATSSSPRSDQVVFEIRDNGLGMDLDLHRKNLFKLYNRFHQHVAGRGMGLYLVKSQMEVMGGSIEVESTPWRGSTFRLVFSIPADLNRQVFFESDAAQLYYDAFINNTVIIWKRTVSSQEYRTAFEAMLQSLQTYRTPGWIADVTKQGIVSTEDQKWFISTVLKVAAENGLVRIGTVGLTDPIRKDYFDRMTKVTSDLGIAFRHFQAISDAVDWMRHTTLEHD